MEGRLNPSFFGEGYQSLLKTLSSIPHIRKLGDLISDGAFGVLPPGNSYVEDGGIRFLRATELQNDNRIDWNACLRAPIEFARHERAQLKIGDVLIAVKGATIASEKSVCTVDLLDEQTIINGSIFRFQPTAETTSAFLREVLSSNFIKQQMKASLILNNAVDYLSRTSLDSLAFPLPAIRTQRLLVEEMETARAARKQKLAEADALLASVDDFVLRQLGLTAPKEEKRLSFAVRRCDVVRNDTCNPDYYHSERMASLRGIQSNKQLRCSSLEEITDFIREAVDIDDSSGYIGLASVQSNTGELVEIPKQDIEGKCFVFCENDVLFARLRPYLNKIWRAEFQGFCSTEFHVIRVKLGQQVLPDYLASILRSSLILAQTKHMMTGNTHPRLANEAVVNLVIPIPDENIQQTIAAEIARRREQARSLREQANTEWETAKAHFEAQLLGEA